MKATMCSMLLLPSLLWAQVESSEVDDRSKVETDNVLVAVEEKDEPYSPEEPEVPESIAKRAKEANGLFQQREDRETATVNNPFVMTPHKPNYFFVCVYLQPK